MAKPDSMKGYSVEDLAFLMLAMRDAGIAMFECGEVKMSINRGQSSAASSIAPVTTKQAYDAIAASRLESEKQRLSNINARRTKAAGGIGAGSVESLVTAVYKDAMRTRPTTQLQPTGQGDSSEE